MGGRTTYGSWGGFDAGDVPVLRPRRLAEMVLPEGGWLAYGAGRSYGDSCLPSGGALIDMRGANRILAFDMDRGIVRAEAGLLLGDLIRTISPWGWFPAVLPGTQHVTLGGAIANDIHGKNHHVAGTFGEHVRAFGLLRSDGLRACSAREESELFHATIGGLGLTGLITWVELQLMRAASPDVMQEAIPLETLADFFRIAAASDATHAYSVAWIDSLAKGRALGRGVLLRANHAPAAARRPGRAKPLVSVLFTPPFSLVNSASLRAFNAIYRSRTLASPGPGRVAFSSFFFPLDAVGHWNRLYGPRGLRQHQSIIPLARAEAAIASMLEATHRAGQGSFLTVLKAFADRPAAGMLSFPKAGATLTLDFPYRGAETDALLDDLDELTLAAGGRVNPYKDAHMTAETFAASFPQAEAFRRFIDPQARSRFAERVGLRREAQNALAPEEASA